MEITEAFRIQNLSEVKQYLQARGFDLLSTSLKAS